jgi:hypothetical protein
MAPQNTIGKQLRAQMPTVPPMYVRDKIVAPGSQAYTESISQKAQAEAHGRQEAADYGLQFLRYKKVVKPFSYTTDAVPVVLPANGRATAVITINKEASFEWDKLSAVVDIPALGLTQVRGDDFTFRIRDDRKGQFITNGFLHNLAATGSNIFPLVLPQSKFFQGSDTISIEMVNRRGQVVNVFWEFSGKNFYSREFENLTAVPTFTQLSKQEQRYFLATQRKYVEPYFYTFDAGPVTIPAGGTLTDQLISIQQQGDFELFAWTAFSDAPFTWIARESNTGRFLMNRALGSGTSVGDGERPRLLSDTYWLDSNSEIFVTLNNLDALNANQVFLCLIGRVWYDTASMNLVTGPDFYYDKYRSL